MEENLTTEDYVDDDDSDRAWDIPVNLSHLANLSDVQYLSRILGPRRMGYEVTIIAKFKIIYLTEHKFFQLNKIVPSGNFTFFL